MNIPTNFSAATRMLLFQTWIFNYFAAVLPFCRYVVLLFCRFVVLSSWCFAVLRQCRNRRSDLSWNRTKSRSEARPQRRIVPLALTESNSGHVCKALQPLFRCNSGGLFARKAIFYLRNSFMRTCCRRCSGDDEERSPQTGRLSHLRVRGRRGRATLFATV